MKEKQYKEWQGSYCTHKSLEYLVWPKGTGCCLTWGVYGPGVIGSRLSRSAASRAASLAVEMSFSNWVKCSSYCKHNNWWLFLKRLFFFFLFRSVKNTLQATQFCNYSKYFTVWFYTPGFHISTLCQCNIFKTTSQTAFDLLLTLLWNCSIKLSLI